MADTKINNDVRDVLVRSSCNANQLYLPAGQLDRGLYERVNKALANAGGKWNRSAKAHIFPVDAGTKLAAMLNSGVSVDEKKRDQSFFTPPELACQVAELADVKGCVVLEPSAGRGALADACMAAGATEVVCFESNADYADELLLVKEYRTTLGDFLRFESSNWKLFGRIVMNPPFTKNQDIAHVKHALTWLAPGGTLVSLMMPNQNRKGFQEIINNEGYETEIIQVPRDAFKESGTSIATIILKLTRKD